MTETESKWADRVQAWQASGQTAPAFCYGKDFTPGGLRYWAHRLRNAGRPTPAKELRIARVVRAAQPASPPQPETPIVIEVRDARRPARVRSRGPACGSRCARRWPMIPHGVEVFVVLDTIDLRWSFDRLSSLVAGRLGRDVRGGALFVFLAAR